MSNDGWGKLPTNSDPWVKAQGSSAWPSPITPNTNTAPINVQAAPAPDAWPKPAVSDDWGEFGSGTVWPTPNTNLSEVILAQDDEETHAKDYHADIDYQGFSHVDYTPKAKRDEAEFEAQWTRDSLEGAHNRASVINSLRGTKDEYTIDQDGQLDNVTETVRAKKTGEPTGFYLAYSDGKWLHAILSGPYDTSTKALAQADAVWAKFTDDSAFKLAFSNKFNRDGIYCAEIPLSAKRKGAYGVLTP